MKLSANSGATKRATKSTKSYKEVFSFSSTNRLQKGPFTVPTRTNECFIYEGNGISNQNNIILYAVLGQTIPKQNIYSNQNTILTTERKGERESGTDRQTDRDRRREAERQRQTDRQRQKERDRDRQRQRWIKM